MVAVNETASRYAPDLSCDGQPQHPRLVWKDDPDHVKLSTFIQEAFERGVLLHFGGLNPSYAHGMFEAAETVFRLGRAMKAVMNGIPLKGLPCQPAFQRDPGAKRRAA